MAVLYDPQPAMPQVKGPKPPSRCFALDKVCAIALRFCCWLFQLQVRLRRVIKKQTLTPQVRFTSCGSAFGPVGHQRGSPARLGHLTRSSHPNGGAGLIDTRRVTNWHHAGTPTANWHLRAHTRLSANPVPTLARCSLTSTSMESRDNIARHLSLARARVNFAPCAHTTRTIADPRFRNPARPGRRSLLRSHPRPARASWYSCRIPGRSTFAGCSWRFKTRQKLAGRSSLLGSNWAPGGGMRRRTSTTAAWGGAQPQKAIGRWGSLRRTRSRRSGAASCRSRST